MSQPNKYPRLSGLFGSLYFKCVAMVAVSVIVVGSTIQAYSVRQQQIELRNQIEHRGLETTQLLAGQIGGAVKFGNIGALEEIINGVMETAGRDATGGVVTTLDGDVLFATPAGKFEITHAQDMAQRAIATGEVAVATDRQGFAYPVRFGADNNVIGAVFSQWDSQFLERVMWQEIFFGQRLVPLYLLWRC